MVNKHMKRWSMSPVITCKSKSQWDIVPIYLDSYNQTDRQLTSISKSVKKLNHIAGQNVNYCSHFGKVWQFLKKWKHSFYITQQLYSQAHTQEKWKPTSTKQAKKPDTKGHILHDYIYMKRPK